MGSKLCSCNYCVSRQILWESNLSNPQNQIQFCLSKADTIAKRDFSFIDNFEESPNTMKKKTNRNLSPLENIAKENKFNNKIKLIVLKFLTQKAKQFSDLNKKKNKNSNQNNNKDKERTNHIFEKMNKLNSEAKNNINPIISKQETTIIKQKNLKSNNSTQDDTTTQEIEELKKGLTKKIETNQNNSTNLNSSDNSEIWKNETKSTQNPPPKKNYIFKNKQKLKNSFVDLKNENEHNVHHKRSTTFFGVNNFGNIQPQYEQNNHKESIDYTKKSSIDNFSNHNNEINISVNYKDMTNFHSDNLSFNEYE